MKRLRGRIKGCVLILMIPLIPYLLNMIALIRSDIINRAKWAEQDIHNYEITLSHQWGSMHGETTITFNQDKRIGYVGDSTFDTVNTVDDLFVNPVGCGLLFPIGRCGVEYDATYGFPKKVATACPMIECYTETRVINFYPIE
ncbi:MAG: DUF6174 domain-containing protein [Anaerolineae bacterium]